MCIRDSRRENLPFHLLRAVLGTIGILCNFYAVDHLVLSNASILNKMSPFFVLIFSYLFLKEKLTPFQISAFVVAFAGSLFVVKPTLSNLDLGPSLIGLCSGIAAGGAYTMVRILGLRGERSSVIVLFFSVFSCLSVVPWMIFHFQPMTWRQLLMLIGAGISATGGQFGITLAYTHACLLYTSGAAAPGSRPEKRPCLGADKAFLSSYQSYGANSVELHSIMFDH